MPTLAFTGHRPQDLPTDWTSQTFSRHFDLLMPRISRYWPAAFVTGGALGVDSFAASYALNVGAALHLVLPFTPDVMGARWGLEARKRLDFHIRHAASVDVLHQGPYNGSATYQRRNEAMVDRADLLVAVWSGKRQGGTWNCIRYAHSVGRPMVNIFRESPTRIGARGGDS